MSLLQPIVLLFHIYCRTTHFELGKAHDFSNAPLEFFEAPKPLRLNQEKLQAIWKIAFESRNKRPLHNSRVHAMFYQNKAANAGHNSRTVGPILKLVPIRSTRIENDKKVVLRVLQIFRVYRWKHIRNATITLEFQAFFIACGFSLRIFLFCCCIYFSLVRSVPGNQPQYYR